MIPASWVPHRRDDGEVVGWIDMTVAEPLVVPIDRLGRPMDPVDDWHEAEQEILKRRAEGGTRQASFSKDDLDFMGHRLPMMTPYRMAPDWLAPWRSE